MRPAAEPSTVAAVMAMAVSLDGSVALSVSADHLVGRYDLGRDSVDAAGTVHRTKHPGNGAVAIHDEGRVCAIGGWDGRVRLFSTKSFKPLGTLVHHKAGTGIQALAFAHVLHYGFPTDPGGQHCRCRSHNHRRHRHNHHDEQLDPQASRKAHASAADADSSTEEDTAEGREGRGGGGVDEDDDDEMTMGEKARRARWLVSGGKDGRVVIWELMDFNGARLGGSGRQQRSE